MTEQDNDARKADWDEIKAATNRIMSMLDPQGEREYELHDKSFLELVDFWVMLATTSVPSHIKPQFDPVELLKFYTELFSNPEILHAKFSEHIDRIFLLIGSHFNDYGLPVLIENPAIPLSLRENAAQIAVRRRVLLSTKVRSRSVPTFLKNASIHEQGNFSLQAGWSSPKMMRQFREIPPSGRLGENRPEDMLPYRGKQSIKNRDFRFRY